MHDHFAVMALPANILNVSPAAPAKYLSQTLHYTEWWLTFPSGIK